MMDVEKLESICSGTSMRLSKLVRLFDDGVAKFMKLV